MKPPVVPGERDSGEPVWMVVATTAGYTEAAIIAGRLSSLGIPSFIHRESLGAVLGLSIGLGQASVVVPEAYYEAAMAVLEPDDTIPWLSDGDEADFDEMDESEGWEDTEEQE